MAPTVVGLDIGSTAVRAVEVTTRGRTAKIRKAGRVALPPGAVEGGAVRVPHEVTAAVRRLWHEQKFSTRNVRLGVGNGSVLIRPVELEWMPAQDLRKAMRYLVADLVPVPVDEANIDHVLLGEVERDGCRMARVLLVATARDGIDTVVRSVRAAGVRPTTADLAPLALVRAATRGRTGMGTEAIVDVGAEKIAVAVHTDGSPRFARVIPGVGGATLTHSLVDLTGEETAEAEQRKLTSSLRDTDATGQALRRSSEQVALEVRETLQFYVAADADHPPQRLLLTGRGGVGDGFAQVLSETTGIPVEVLSTPSARQSRSAAPRDDADLAVSYGLCLGASA